MIKSDQIEHRVFIAIEEKKIPAYGRENIAGIPKP